MFKPIFIVIMQHLDFRRPLPTVKNKSIKSKNKNLVDIKKTSKSISVNPISQVKSSLTNELKDSGYLGYSSLTKILSIFFSLI